MTELIIEILGYIAMAALLGFLLGWLTWGWGHGDRISAARAEGARAARTSVDGSAGLRDQLRTSAGERARLEAEIDRLTEQLAAAEVAAGLRAEDAVEPAEDDADGAASAPEPAGPAADTRQPASAPGPTTAGGDEAANRQPGAADGARGGAMAAAMSGGPDGAVEGPPARPSPTPAGDGDGPRRADELAARLASFGPPDVTLRKRIVSGTGPADEAASEPDPGAVEPDMPHPPAFTLRRQRVTGSHEPPVIDEQVPPSDRPAGEPDMPRPAAGTLRRQRVRDEADEPPVIDEQLPEPDAAASARPDEAAARPRPTAPASLLAERPAEIDDLRSIKGLGSMTERLLNRNGIWLYRQLAGLTPAETAWLADVLDVPISRIERERWVEQAVSLHLGKHGRAEDGASG